MDDVTQELSSLIASALNTTLEQLGKEHPGHYYYFTLVTTGDALAPVFSAWSVELLNDAIRKEADSELALEDFKWSYADSPLLEYGQAFFADVKRLVDSDRLRNLRPDDRAQVLLSAMELGCAEAERRGAFSGFGPRDNFVVTAEIMPPDSSNTERVQRLNPPAAIETWLDEAAE